MWLIYGVGGKGSVGHEGHLLEAAIFAKNINDASTYELRSLYGKQWSLVLV
jgi:hypothetical protein